MTRRRLYRIGCAVAAVVVLLAAIVLVVGNVFLKSGLADEVINRRPEKLRVDYASAYSPWPGRVVVDEFRIRGQTRSVQWEATADRIEGDIGLIPLLAKRFVASDVRGEGVVFRLRRRRDSSEEVDAAEGKVPPIRGLDNPPTPPPEAIYDLPEDRRRWTVSLRDWRLDRVREIWIDRYRYHGSAAVDGGLAVQLKRTTEIEPTTLSLTAGRVEVGEEAIASGLEGELTVECEQFRHPRNRGVDAVPFFDVRVATTATVRDVGFLNSYVDELPWLAFESGEGDLETDLRVTAGRLVPGSQLRLVPDPIALRVLDYRARGAGLVEWRATDENGGTGRLTTRFDDFSIERIGYDSPHVRGRGLTVEVTSGDLGVPARFDDAVMVAEIPAAAVPDFSFYDAYIPESSGVSISAGSGTISGGFEFRADDATGTGSLDLRGRDLRVDYRGGKIAGNLEIAMAIPTADLRARRFEIGGTELRIEAGRIVGGGAEESAEAPWWAEARVESGHLQPGGATTLDATAQVTMKDSRPVVGIFALHRGLPGWLQRALRVEDIRGDGRLRVGQEFVELDRFRAEGEKVAVEGRLRLASDSRHGVLLLSYRDLDLGVRLRGTETDYKFTNVAEWYDRQVSGGD